MCYLHDTIELVLCYRGEDLKLRECLDVDEGRDSDESRLTLAYVFNLGGGVISLCSKRQECITLSTMEAEYITCTLATQEAMWLRSFLQDLNLTPRVDDPVEMLCDNTATIQFAKGPKFH